MASSSSTSCFNAARLGRQVVVGNFRLSMAAMNHPPPGCNPEATIIHVRTFLSN
jgi:hypothetical protein